MEIVCSDDKIVCSDVLKYTFGFRKPNVVTVQIQMQICKYAFVFRKPNVVFNKKSNVCVKIHIWFMK